MEQKLKKYLDNLEGYKVFGTIVSKIDISPVSIAEDITTHANVLSFDLLEFISKQTMLNESWAKYLTKDNSNKSKTTKRTRKISSKALQKAGLFKVVMFNWVAKETIDFLNAGTSLVLFNCEFIPFANDTRHDIYDGIIHCNKFAIVKEIEWDIETKKHQITFLNIINIKS